MRMTSLAICVLAVSLVFAACGRPDTDIVATTTEDVGWYGLTSTVVDNELTGRVCVAQPKNADVIAYRIRQQLANHEFRTVTLDLYASAGSADSGAAIGRYVWTGAEASRQTAPARPNACETRADASTSHEPA
jgi:hypothetical protein